MAIPPEETLNGLIERVTFHNQETGFCVLKVKAKGHKDLVVVIGACAVVTAGEWIEAGGFWIQDRQYGQQFKALSLRATPPTTLAGIEKYLGSGMIKGIGPVYASKLVKAFGEGVFTVIEEGRPGAAQNSFRDWPSPERKNYSRVGGSKSYPGYHALFAQPRY